MSARAPAAAPRLARLVAERERVVESFFVGGQDALARACHDIARSLWQGGTLLAHGTGAAATDAAHVAVELMHPVIVGKRALPALALPPGGGLGPLARAGDVALAIDHGPAGAETRAFLAEARERGLVTVALTGGEPARADHALAVPSDDPAVVQEVQETAYHVLWELVHVFFEHPGLVAEACVTCGDVAVEATVVAAGEASATVERGGAREEVATELVGPVAVGDVLLCHAGAALQRVEAAPEPAGFLYPFLEREERDLDAVLADVRESTVRKAADASELRRAIDVGAIERCAHDVRARLERGGRLVAFGNGGSSTDAQDLALDLRARGWAALAVNDDVATITAVGNDVGYDNSFARPLIALGRADDVAVAITTSGSSPNVLAGLGEARRRGMLTCAIAGYDGGRLAELGWLDHLLAVGGDYVPRLQEAHATIYHLLVEAIGGRA